MAPGKSSLHASFEGASKNAPLWAWHARAHLSSEEAQLLRWQAGSHSPPGNEIFSIRTLLPRLSQIFSPKRSSKGRGSCSDSTSYHARAEGASGLTPSRLRPSPNPLHLARRPAGQDAETLRLTADRVCSRGGQMRRENTPRVPKLTQMQSN